MTGWVWTWQDALVLVLAVGGIVLARWLHRRIGTRQGCGRCPAKALHARKP